MKVFVVKHGELQIQALSVAPIYALLDGPPSKIHSPLFDRISSFGVSLNDVKITVGIPNLNELSLAYHLLTYNAIVKLSLDKVDINFFETTNVTRERIEDLYRKTFEGISVISPDTRFKEFVLTIAIHGFLEEGTISDFTNGFVTAIPNGLGPIAGLGAVFYYSGSGLTKSSATVIDVSARVVNGLFLRTSVTFDGQRVSVDDFPGAATKAFDDQMENLGLTLKLNA